MRKSPEGGYRYHPEDKAFVSTNTDPTSGAVTKWQKNLSPEGIITLGFTDTLSDEETTRTGFQSPDGTESYQLSTYKDRVYHGILVRIPPRGVERTGPVNVELADEWEDRYAISVNATYDSRGNLAVTNLNISPRPPKKRDDIFTLSGSDMEDHFESMSMSEKIHQLAGLYGLKGTRALFPLDYRDASQELLNMSKEARATLLDRWPESAREIASYTLTQTTELVSEVLRDIHTPKKIHILATFLRNDALRLMPQDFDLITDDEEKHHILKEAIDISLNKTLVFYYDMAQAQGDTSVSYRFDTDENDISVINAQDKKEPYVPSSTHNHGDFESRLESADDNHWLITISDIAKPDEAPVSYLVPKSIPKLQTEIIASALAPSGWENAFQLAHIEHAPFSD